MVGTTPDSDGVWERPGTEGAAAIGATGVGATRTGAVNVWAKAGRSASARSSVAAEIESESGERRASPSA